MPPRIRDFQTEVSTLSAQASALQIDIIQAIRHAAVRLINDPQDMLAAQNHFEARLTQLVDQWDEEIEVWVNESIPKAYKKGLQFFDIRGQAIEPHDIAAPNLFVHDETKVVREELSDAGKLILQDVPHHWTFASTFQGYVKNELQDTTFQILRESKDAYREVAIMAGSRDFQAAATITRRQFSHDLLDGFAKRGITGIVYRDGKHFPLDSYAEMVGRTQMANTSRQAAFNRIDEFGYSLVRVSSHARSCPICDPWQGRVYTLHESADSNYPPLAEAQSGGLFHPNCLHGFSPYRPGTSPPLRTRYAPGEQRLIDQYGKTKGTRIAYQAQQKQRYIERQIRQWKRREAAALTQEGAKKATRKVRQWQASQRAHLQEFEFLPRKYEREQLHL